MKRTLVAVALVVIFVLALAAPAFAMFHTATVNMDGTINFKSQAGHACNTGGVMKQTIAGSGTLDKAMTILMRPGILTVNDSNNWVAGATPLTVTSVWELCTPPKYTIDVEDGVTIGGEDYDVTVPVDVTAMYNDTSKPYAYYGPLGIALYGRPVLGNTVPVMAEYWDWDALTGQIWAVQVQADPGFSGNLSQQGEAAYGPSWGWTNDDDVFFSYDDEWLAELLDGYQDKSDTWRWELDKDLLWGEAVGADFVGDYFTMEQHARTSQGTLKRYVDISSPWTHGYLNLDMSVVGKSDIRDAFAMNNLPAGKDVPKDWWRLF